MRVNGRCSSSCSAFYKEIRSLLAASVPSIPCFPLGPLYAQTCSDNLACIQEGCLCSRGTFFSLISCLSSLSLWSPLQPVCLQTACLLCLLLLVHEFHLVSPCLNNYWYQLPPILLIAHAWKEESNFRLLRLKLLYVKRGFSPFSLYLKKCSIPFLLLPQAEPYFFLYITFPCFSSLYLVVVDCTH